mgnify:CR=1 FL=1
MSVIKPTVGRIVLFTPDKNDPLTRNGNEPLAAIVACVHSDSCVNLGVIDAQGNNVSRTSVPLIQDGDPKPSTGYYCEWMPYQLGQAAKTESLAKQLSERRPLCLSGGRSCRI